MREQGLVAIERLQHEEVGNFGGATAARSRYPPGESFATMTHESEQLGRESRQPLSHPYLQHRRHEPLIQLDVIV